MTINLSNHEEFTEALFGNMKGVNPGIAGLELYEFRYALRILPIERVVPTDLEEIKRATAELASKISENETFRVTVEKRFTSLHTKDLIEVAAVDIKQKANLKNPDKILLIEVLGASTGVSLLKPSDILAVVKEKML